MSKQLLYHNEIVINLAWMLNYTSRGFTEQRLNLAKVKLSLGLINFTKSCFIEKKTKISKTQLSKK